MCPVQSRRARFCYGQSARFNPSRLRAKRRPLQKSALHQNVVMRNARYGSQLGLVGVQFFFDEGFDDRPQNFVRDLLHHVGTHFLQDPRDHGFDV